MKKLIHILLILGFSANLQSQSWVRVKPVDFSFNESEYSEIAPVIYGGALIFCWNKKTEGLFTNVTQDNEPLFDIYLAEKNDKNEWVPRLLSEEITTRFHEGPVTISADGREIYYTKNILNSAKEDNYLGIFRATLSKNGISNEREFKFNSAEYNVCFPSLSADGKELYFASDRPDGLGNYDIWVCKRTRSTWGEPENLGDKINTRRNEVYPYIHQSGRLYFSSNGIDKSVGRLDIYFSEKINSDWSVPENLGEPINTRRDDYSIFFADETLRSGYYTSNINRSSHDIFYFESTLPEFDACKEVEENNYCYTFFDEGAGTLDTTTLKYQWDLGDGTTIVGLEADHCFEGPGEYEVKLNVIDALTGETYFNEATYHFPIEDIVQAYISCADTVRVNAEVSFSGSDSYIKEFEQYIWDFGDYYNAVGENVNHIFKKPGQYTVKLGVTNGAENPDELLKSCSFKKITVLP